MADLAGSPNVFPPLLTPEVAVPAPRIWSDEELRSRLATAPDHFSLNLRTMEEAVVAAELLSHRFAAPETAEMGLWELLANAIEHGNLGITYEEKTVLLGRDGLHAEVAQRLRLPVFRDRRATLTFTELPNRFEVLVADQGDGFDFARYSKRDIASRKPHGRGIAIARDIAFDTLTYRGTGSEVLAISWKPGCEPDGWVI